MTRDYVIEMREITKIFGDFVANDHINLNVRRGEIHALLGENGAGKSTLMNILGCLDTPTTGSYLLDNEEVANLSEDVLAKIRNKKIGFVFQNFNLLSRISALENVALPLVYAGVSKTERINRAQELLKMVGLADRQHHMPNELSGGQRQRVAIARALVNNPKIIMADEPTGNLDSQTGQKVEKLLFDLNKKSGITLIIVTHDQSLADKCDRQIHIKDGKIIKPKKEAK
mgnify:CR=1 FL=1